MKKLVSLMSALLVGAFVGCAAEDSTTTPAPVTPVATPADTGMEGTATPEATPEETGTPAESTETPAEGTETPEATETPAATDAP